ncbi:MAG: class I SAM-dependent methyltransferase [Azonexus sp.]|nr:class I SAM-dependent methyltransferase [Azonexus sp.]
MKNIINRALVSLFHVLGFIVGRVAMLTRVNDEVLAGFLARLFVHAERNDASIAAVVGAATSSAVLIDNVNAFDGHEDVSAIINFSAKWRDEWVIRKASEIPNGALVLDAGAGECQYRKYFGHTNYSAQDFAGYEGTSDGLQKEQWNYGKIDYVCDITSIPVPDESFDVVLCTEVLEHVPDPIATLKELTRVLRPGGRLLLSAPLGCGLHQQPYHYYGGFTPYFYKDYLSRFGAEVTEMTPLGGLLRHVAQECHRVGRVISENKANVPEKSILDLMMNWLPRVLSGLDDKYFVEEFTVGYLVEARKLERAPENNLSSIAEA